MIYEWFFEKPSALNDNKTALAEAIMYKIADGNEQDQSRILAEIFEKWPDISIVANGHKGLNLEAFDDFSGDNSIFHCQKIKSVLSTSESSTKRAEELVKYLSSYETLQERIFVLNLFILLLNLTNSFPPSLATELSQYMFNIDSNDKRIVEKTYNEQIRNLLGILLVSRDLSWIATAVFHQLRSVKDFEARATLLFYLMYLDVPDFSSIFLHIDFSQHYNVNGQVFTENREQEIQAKLKFKIKLIDRILTYSDYQEMVYLIGPLLHIIEDDSTPIEQMVLLKYVLENTVSR